MATYMTYKCDRCGKEWLSTDKSEQPVSIGLAINFGDPSGHPPQRFHGFEKDLCTMWCRSCVMSLGLHSPITKEEKAEAPPELSFEDKIITFLNDLGFYQEE